MGAVVEGLVRLAWHADGEGKPGTRDALLTLVVAESLADDAVLAERCRKTLVKRQPGHWFAASPTVSEALARDKVAVALTKLRQMFPPVRVQWMLMREEIRRGPYTGRAPSLANLIDDLAPAPERCPDAPRAVPFSTARPGGSPIDADGSLAALYLAVLLAMAVLLQGVLQAGANDSKAA